MALPVRRPEDDDPPKDEIKWTGNMTAAASITAIALIGIDVVGVFFWGHKLNENLPNSVIPELLVFCGLVFVAWCAVKWWRSRRLGQPPSRDK